MDSPGSLVDKISVCNNKLWHAQELVGATANAPGWLARLSSWLTKFPPPRRPGLDAETVKKLYHLNLERSALINEYNELVGWKGPQIVKVD